MGSGLFQIYTAWSYWGYILLSLYIYIKYYCSQFGFLADILFPIFCIILIAYLLQWFWTIFVHVPFTLSFFFPLFHYPRFNNTIIWFRSLVNPLSQCRGHTCPSVTTSWSAFSLLSPFLPSSQPMGQTSQFVVVVWCLPALSFFLTLFITLSCKFLCYPSLLILRGDTIMTTINIICMNILILIFHL